MRLVTLNTWGMRGDWTTRLPVLQDGLRALDADVILLQETILTDAVDQAADMLGPGYQLDRERERRVQSVAAARRLEELVAQAPGHVVVAGDLDADSASDSLRFWTGRHVIDDVSVCYRSAWEATPNRAATPSARGSHRASQRERGLRRRRARRAPASGPAGRTSAHGSAQQPAPCPPGADPCGAARSDAVRA
jgi:endonuclease/exonuclease/phosphatase family metal-dependent hydrolase